MGIELGFDPKRVRKEIEREDWEDARYGAGQSRRVYLGTVFKLYPSGKYYTPFACNNLKTCPVCNGTGQRPGPLSRREKKAKSRSIKMSQLYMKRYGYYGKWPAKYAAAMRKLNCITSRTCINCGGHGSREAYLDELWREKAEAALEAEGLALTEGEGDPCDLFAEESRDRPNEAAS